MIRTGVGVQDECESLPPWHQSVHANAALPLCKGCQFCSCKCHPQVSMWSVDQEEMCSAGEPNASFWFEGTRFWKVCRWQTLVSKHMSNSTHFLCKHPVKNRHKNMKGDDCVQWSFSCQWNCCMCRRQQWWRRQGGRERSHHFVWPIKMTPLLTLYFVSLQILEQVKSFCNILVHASLWRVYQMNKAV